MAMFAARARASSEGVTWDGTNNAAVLDLVQRVAGLHVWAPLENGVTVAPAGRGMVGLAVCDGAGTPLLRVEMGNTLMFDPFAKTPLFVVTPADLAAFYQVSG